MSRVKSIHERLHESIRFVELKSEYEIWYCRDCDVHFREPRRLEFSAIGLTRPRDVLFVDLDTKNFDVYETGDGAHVVAQLPKPFDYRFDRLRISPKFNFKGEIVNPAPELVYCHCPNHIHIDKRLKGKLEMYITRHD